MVDDDQQQQQEKRVLSIQQLLALHQNAPVAAANLPRRRAQKDFVIDLEGSQLAWRQARSRWWTRTLCMRTLCSLAAAASHPMR